MGVKEEKMVLSSDMIFMMKPPAKERSLKILKDNVHGYKGDEKLIGFSVREWKDKDRTDLFAEVADKLVEKYNARIVFFPFHKPKDAEISKIIMHKMKHEDKTVLMPNRYLPSEILGTMGLMDVNIGVRLHALVFSALMNVPTIGISYEPKIDGFLEMIDMTPVCTYENISVEKILEKVEYFMQNKNVNYAEKTSMHIAIKADNTNVITIYGVEHLSLFSKTSYLLDNSSCFSLSSSSIICLNF